MHKVSNEALSGSSADSGNFSGNEACQDSMCTSTIAYPRHAGMTHAGSSSAPIAGLGIVENGRIAQRRNSSRKAGKTEIKNCAPKAAAFESRNGKSNVHNGVARQTNPNKSQGPSYSKSFVNNPASKQRLKPNGIARKTANNHVPARRTSIDCTYQLWKLGEQDASKRCNCRQPSFVDLYINSSNSVDKDALILPLISRKSNSSELLNVESDQNDGKSTRQRSQSGTPGLRPPSSDCYSAIKSPSPIPPDRMKNFTFPNRRSYSVDYGNGQLNMSTGLFSREGTGSKSTMSSERLSQRKDSIPMHTIPNHSGNPPRQRPGLTSNSRSYGSLQNARLQYDVIPSNSVTNTNQCDDEMGSYGAWADQPAYYAPRTNRGRGNFRSSSVSPASLSSVDKQSERLIFNRSRRRASLPNTGYYTGQHASFGEATKSPEFFKAINELSCENNPNIEIRIGSEPHTSSARSTSSVASVKEPNLLRRDALQRIEEISPEPGGHQAANAESTPVSNVKSPLEGNDLQPVNTRVGADEEDPSQLEESTNDRLKAADNQQVLEKDTFKNEAAQSSETKLSQSAAKSTPSQSLFYLPENGISTKKVTSRLEHTKEISKNEENRHFVSGLPEREEADDKKMTEDYLTARGWNEEDDENVIDVRNIYEEDDDLCDEDFKEKRIIRWLMEAQTGGNAEQNVRNETPPPSPEPNRQTAIVVVYSGEQKSR